MFNREEVKKWLMECIENAVAENKDEKEKGKAVCGTWFKWLDKSGDNWWAICMAFANPDMPDEETLKNDRFVDNEGDRLSVKLATQPWNSMLQCDYDVDWMMPVVDGDVYDTERQIYEGYDVDEIVDGLMNDWNELHEDK